MLAYWLEFLAEGVLVPGLAPHRDGLQVFLIEFLCAIAEIEDDLTIILAQSANHEHDLEGRAERVARKGELPEQFAEVGLVRVRGGVSLGEFLEKMPTFPLQFGFGRHRRSQLSTWQTS